MKLPNWLWPHTRRDADDPMVRGGRVAHWGGLTAAALVSLIALTSTPACHHHGDYFGTPDCDPSSAPTFFAIAIALALAGRGARYVLAGE